VESDFSGPTFQSITSLVTFSNNKTGIELEETTCETKRKRVTLDYAIDRGKRLSERDLRILNTLNSYTILTAQQIRRLCFPNLSKESTTNISRRLRQLTNLRFVDDERKRPRGATVIYYLGPASLQILAMNSRKEYRKVKEHHYRMVQALLGDRHKVTVNEVIVALEIDERNGNGRLITWDNYDNLSLKYKYKGKTDSLEPDGRGVWEDIVFKERVPFLIIVDDPLRTVKAVQHIVFKSIRCFSYNELAKSKEKRNFRVLLLVDPGNGQRHKSLVSWAQVGAQKSNWIPERGPWPLSIAVASLREIIEVGPSGPIWEEVLTNRRDLTLLGLLPNK